MPRSISPHLRAADTSHKKENTMKRAAALALGITGLIAIAGPTRADSDWEYWSQYEVAWKAGADVQLRLKPELRFRDDFSDYYYIHVEVGVDWRFRDWLTLAPYYRYISQESKGDWKTEKRPEADATLAWEVRDFGFSDRNRLEYRITADRETFRYRNRLWVKPPKITRAGVQPFLAEEVFYDFDADELNKNRVYAGFSVGLADGLNADVYYIMDSSKKTDEWSRINILATALKYRF
jgi:hypothetical protein